MNRPETEFRLISWNIEHNGNDRRGNDRWHLAMGILAGLRPHVVLRQELTWADRNGGEAMWLEATAIAGKDRPQFVPHPAPATPESPNPTCVYVDPTLCRTVACYQHATGMWHPASNPVVRLRGAGLPLSLCSFHLCSFDPSKRESEAKRLATLGKPRMATIMGGDCNSYVHRPGEERILPPDWNQVEDRSHFEARTVNSSGRRVSDLRPDRILAGSVNGQQPLFVELGHYAGTSLQQPDALKPTASMWRKDQGPPQRIDRAYVTPQLAPALIKFEVVDTDEVREASDHALVMATFSLPCLMRALSPRP